MTKNKDIFDEPYKDDFLADGSGKFYWNGKEMNDREAQDMVSEAQTIMAFGLYEKLIRLLKTVGYQNIARAKNWDETQFGKASLYMAFKIDEIMNNIVNPPQDGKKV